MMALKSRMVEFKTEGGAGNGYLSSPEKPRRGVLVLHAWWGLNDFFKGFAYRLAYQGFLELAPDLHDGAVATSVEGAKELRSKIADERIKRIVLGATDYLRADSSISGHKIGVVGFSMGAAWSLLLSTLKPETVGAVVVFYGSYTMDFSTAEASFLGNFSPEDDWEPIGGVRATEDKIRRSRKPAAFLPSRTISSPTIRAVKVCTRRLKGATHTQCQASMFGSKNLTIVPNPVRGNPG